MDRGLDSRDIQLTDDGGKKSTIIKLNFLQDRRVKSMPLDQDKISKVLTVDVSLKVSSIIVMLEETLPGILADGLCISELVSHGNFINPDYPLSRIHIKENDTVVCVVMTKEDAAKKKNPKDDGAGCCAGCSMTGAAAVCCCCLDGCAAFIEFFENVMDCLDCVATVSSICSICD
jgi:hypothetical protein